jgi:hypothetical protein
MLECVDTQLGIWQGGGKKGTNMSIKQTYTEARQAGYNASQALRVAKIIAAWQEAEAKGLVRLQTQEEQENYFDVYGEPEGYTDIHGRRVSAEKEREEMCASLERDGAWIVYGQWFDGSNWQDGDSVGMNTGYSDPTDWRKNWYVPDIMDATLDALNAHSEERQWAAEASLQTIS